MPTYLNPPDLAASVRRAGGESGRRRIYICIYMNERMNNCIHTYIHIYICIQIYIYIYMPTYLNRLDLAASVCRAGGGLGRRRIYIYIYE